MKTRAWRVVEAGVGSLELFLWFCCLRWIYAIAAQDMRWEMGMVCEQSVLKHGFLLLVG